MNLYSIETGRFRLDGGAMFGVVPKALWQRTNPADEHNRINMAMRCLLIEDGNRLVLIDNGLGTKYNDKFAQLYDVDYEHSDLEQSLKAAGFSLADVTDVLLTHLHFDHCGGTTYYDGEGQLQVAFPQAKLWVQKKHMDWAMKPNVREAASFYKENLEPMHESGQLEYLDGDCEFMPGVQLKVVNGHTEAQQLPIIEYKGKIILYGADLLPTSGHLPLPYVMSYDVRPLVTMKEREHYLPWLVEDEIIVFYEHDPEVECSTVVQTDRGKYQPGEIFTLKDL